MTMPRLYEAILILVLIFVISVKARSEERFNTDLIVDTEVFEQRNPPGDANPQQPNQQPGSAGVTQSSATDATPGTNLNSPNNANFNRPPKPPRRPFKPEGGRRPSSLFVPIDELDDEGRPLLRNNGRGGR